MALRFSGTFANAEALGIHREWWRQLGCLALERTRQMESDMRTLLTERNQPPKMEYPETHPNGEHTMNPHTRARQLLESWIRGINQGGHPPATPAGLEKVYQNAYRWAQMEAEAENHPPTCDGQSIYTPAARLTVERLRDAGACEDGIAEFDAAFPDGLIIPQNAKQQIHLLKTERCAARHWGWAVVIGLIPAWSMQEADFHDADLERADLRGADLQYANLQGAHLKGAYLVRADLRYANLTGADLRYATLQGARLTGARLQNADFRHATLTDAYLRHTYYDGARGLNLAGAIT